MKYLIPLVVVMVVLFLLKGKRNDDRPTGTSGRTPRPGTPPAQQMVACATCGTHLPQTDALPGQGQWYCCTQHRDNATH